MTAKEITIIRIIRQYREATTFNRRLDDDEGVAKDIAKSDCFVPLQEDLVDLCEDNEVMQKSIVNYFEKEVDVETEV